MKKSFVIILLISILAACSSTNASSKSNSISATDGSKREDTILATTTSNSFVFDFNNTEYKEVTAWIEKYEAGELVDDQLGYVTTSVGERGSIVVATSKIPANKEQQPFLMGIGDEGGT